MKPFFLSLVASLALMTSAIAEPLDDALKASFDSGQLPGLHGVVIELGDQKLAEIYFPGADESWAQQLGVRQHGPTTLHDLRSVTKSIVGLLYGIALAEGKVPALEAPLYAQVPRYKDLAAQPGREKILVGHALSMQMGLEWNENLPYTDPRNSEIAIEMAIDRYRYVLEQPIREPPGKTWIYSGGAVALIGRLIEDGTGMTLDAYGKTKLFEPLGITQVEWLRGSDNVASAASGLRLTLPDLAKIGRMVAQDDPSSRAGKSMQRCATAISGT
jgi:CubicO group peptidase (beta-lactamase class C family)